MKRLTLLLGLLVCLQSIAVLAQAPPEPAPPVDPFVRVPGGSPPKGQDVLAAAHYLLGIEVFAMSAAEAYTLLQQNKGTQRYTETIELYQAGKARLVTVMAGSGRSGERAVLESDDEFRYPTEFHHPGVAMDQVIGPADWAWQCSARFLRAAASGSEGQCGLPAAAPGAVWKLATGLVG